MADGLEELFDDLNFELEVQPPVTRAQLEAQLPSTRFASDAASPLPVPANGGRHPSASRPRFSAPTVFDAKYADQAMAALDKLAPASVMLTENDPVAAVTTRPYEVPVEELFGDVSSSVLTVPVALDELPEEAYPTALNTALW
ncbi:MAG: hypothetical protein QM723_16725 [Myxococcaceae bacterium]